MNPDEVKRAHGDLKKAISTALSDFGDHCALNNPLEDIYQVACIMQSVLCECVSDMEYQVGRPAPFTRHQTDHICYQIGDWYLMMKPLLEVQHNLGFMKEKLKTMICGED
jgi:hypothetical protein